ncbi:MAG TPA: hypothetical protein VE591_12455, partial [Candidatus Acidoferrum sp.]|nr:hypothetical protein [Candidatus Acidoferrum sp.]
MITTVIIAVVVVAALFAFGVFLLRRPGREPVAATLARPEPVAASFRHVTEAVAPEAPVLLDEDPQ